MTEKKDLFGFPIDDQPASKTSAAAGSRRRAEPLSPAIATEAVIRTAQTMPPTIHLGTSSWSFPGWEGLVYAGAHSESKLARDGLAAYAAYPLFATVSIDRTFYAPLSEAEFANYANQVPSHFRFLVKAPMAITSSYLRDDTGKFSDSPFFFNADYAINEFIAPCSAGLGEKCGPLVFQFPPQGNRVTANPDLWINQLYRFLIQLPPGLIYAVEIRDSQLLTDRFFKCLSATHTHFCVASHARMPSPAAQIARMNSFMRPDIFIARWSLHSGFKYEDAKSRYFPFNKLVDEDPDSRNALAEAIVAASRNGHASYVTINNKAEGSAPLSVAKLAAQICLQLSPPAQPV